MFDEPITHSTHPRVVLGSQEEEEGKGHNSRSTNTRRGDRVTERRERIRFLTRMHNKHHKHDEDCNHHRVLHQHYKHLSRRQFTVQPSLLVSS